MKTQIGSGPKITSVASWLVASAALICQAQLPPADDFNPVASFVVNTMAVQADGKILVGGNFSTLDGQQRNYIGRLNSDGTLETSFNPGANGGVFALAVQADGKILVGGTFTMLGGLPRNRVGRLNSDGTLDNTFNPGANDTVYSMVQQADGKTLMGGFFTMVGGQPRNRIARLNSNGTLDSTFNPGADYYVNSLAVQADGRILVGGAFTTLGGQPRSRIGRLYSNGTVDAAFNPGAYPYVLCVTLQADGKILVGGGFTTLGGQPRNYIGRLNSNGTVDATFNPGAGIYDYSPVESIVVQADGRILVGSWFRTTKGAPFNYIGRLNSNGTLDATFSPGVDSGVDALAVQPDGKILVCGNFTTLGGQPRKYIGRLNNTSPATHSLTNEGSNITWLRGGTSPEVWRTSFDFSTNGMDWVSLGEGTRISGGWQLSGVSVPANVNIRGRAFLTSGYQDGSSWFVETVIGPAVVLAQPISRVNMPGTTATFEVQAGGTPSLNYGWLKDGQILSDGGSVSGAHTPTLMLSNLLESDGGGYSVIVSNTFGSVTSQVAVLTVIGLGQAVETTNLVWNTGGSTDWFAQSTVAHDGEDALRSGGIAGSQESWLETTVAGPGTLAFWWKVSSETDYDVFEFSIDSVVQRRISGEEDWVQLSFAIPAGSHTLRWRYAKDSSTSLGQDAGWLDEVVFMADSGAPVVLAQPRDQTVGFADTVIFPVGSGGGTLRTYQWFHNDSAINRGTNGSLTLSNVALSAAGNYHLVVSNAWGTTTSSNAALTVTTNGPVATILLFVDDAASSPYRAALLNLGAIFQQFTDHTAFNAMVRTADASRTLVVVDSHAASHVFNAVARFAREGGRVLFQYWGLNINSTVAESFGANVTQVFSWPPGYGFYVFDWSGSMFFTGLPNAVLFGGDLLYDGQKLQPSGGGQAVAGFASASTTNEAAIVVGHAGRTILNGCLLEEALNATDRVRLAQNQIAYLLAVRTPRLFSPSWSGGQFQVSMEGTPGQTYSLRSSSDFIQWSTVTNVTLSTNPATLTIPAPADQSSYLLASPPVP